MMMNRTMRRTVCLILTVILAMTALPAFAVKSGRVEDVKAERTESGITVTMPAGYADTGYYKLFWMNEETGEVQNAVFQVDTPFYQIEAEEGAEYSIALFYAKKRAALPSSWKGDTPKEPQGPSVWKVLWIDAETIDFRGFTNHMSEANHRTSEKVAVDFEAYIEEMTGGLVDIQITRLSVDKPVTSLTHYADDGYTPTQDDTDMKHYALRNYDSVFVFGRMDGIYVKYGGIAFDQQNAREDPLYSFIPLVGDDCLLQGGEAAVLYVCVHEFIHQLSYLYENYSLIIPNPDEMGKYGYDPESTQLDPQFFSDALTMKVLADDGKYIGVPADAWQYKPTHVPAKWDLSYMQDQYGPAKETVQEEPTATPEPENAEIYGTFTETGYENRVMGLDSEFDEIWYLYGPGEFPFTYTEGNISEADPDFLREGQAVMVMYAQSDEQPNDVCLSLDPGAAEYVKENGEEAYWQALKDRYEREASGNGLEDFACEIVESRVGEKTMTALKMEYTVATVRVYTLQVAWLRGDYMNMISVGTFMSDDCESVLAHFRLAD